MPFVPHISPLKRWLSTSDNPLLQLVSSDSIGSITVRQLIPVAIAVPLIFSWLVYQGQQLGWYDTGFGFISIAVCLILMFLGLVGRGASILNQVDGDRKRSDDRLRSREEQLQLALEGAEQGIWDWDLETQVLTWDARCKDIFGLLPGFPVTYEWHIDALHPEDRQRVLDAAAIALRDRATFAEEYRTFHPDGTMRWVLARGRGYYDATGEPCRMSGTVLDITERKLAEAEIQRLNRELARRVDELQTILDAVPVGITISEDPACQIIRANGFAQAMLAVPPDANVSVTGAQAEILPFRQLRNGHEIPGEDLPMQRAVAQGADVRDVEIQMVRADGISFDWLVNAVPLLDEQGEVRGCVAALMDVTALKQAEAALQQTAAELAQTNRLKDEFLAALSHELRTPLNPILGWTKMMRAQRLTPAKTAEALGIIERKVRQQISLVNDLLNVSRVIQGKMALALHSVDLALSVNQAIETIQFSAQAKRITIEQKGLSSLVVMGDRNRLQQIFWNLLSNAIKFTPEGGRVEIARSILDGNTAHYAQVQIIDNGIGIAPEFLPYVFDRFRQADGSSTRKYGGLGLGLSIVRHLVELHGGTVTAESLGEEHGATFTVKLPLPNEIEQSSSNRATLPNDNFLPIEHEHSTELQPLSTTTPALTGVRILLVDDDPDNLDLLHFLLQNDGAIVTATTSAIAALDFITANPVDLFISDIGMPELTGYELIRRIRSLPQRKQVPALALTAFARSQDQAEVLSTGFQAYLSKPVDPLELLTVLTQLLLDQ